MNAHPRSTLTSQTRHIVSPGPPQLGLCPWAVGRAWTLAIGLSLLATLWDPAAATGGGATEANAPSAWKQLEAFFRPLPEWTEDLGSYRSPLEFNDGRRVQGAGQWAARRQEIFESWHRIMGTWPPFPEQPEIQILQTVRRETFWQHRVRVPIAREQSTEGYLLVPEGPGPFPAVLVPYYEPETSIGLSKGLRDFGYQLTKRGFVTLSIGSPGGDAREPVVGGAACQPLSFLAYVASNCRRALARRREVDPARIGIVGHSYGGKWAMFAACLDDQFACGAWSDPGIVFDETRANVNYWDRWYLGAEPGKKRPPGIPGPANPRTGAYKVLREKGHDLHELHALMAPRPFLVSGGSEDPPSRWTALNHAVAVNRVLGQTNRVAMTNRPTHDPTPQSNELIYLFFEHVLSGSALKY